MDKKFDALVTKIDLLHEYFSNQYNSAFEYEDLYNAVEYRAKRNLLEDLQIYIKEINTVYKDPVLEMIRESIKKS